LTKILGHTLSHSVRYETAVIEKSSGEAIKRTYPSFFDDPDRGEGLSGMREMSNFQETPVLWAAYLSGRRSEDRGGVESSSWRETAPRILGKRRREGVPPSNVFLDPKRQALAVRSGTPSKGTGAGWSTVL